MADNNAFTRGPSLEEIAAATLQPDPTQEADQEDEQRTEETEEQVADDGTEEVLEADDVEEAEEGSEEDTPEEEDEVDQDTYTVTVDGEEMEVTLDELATSYQLRSAAQKRLNEATTIRAAAEEEGRAAGMEAAQAEITQRTEAINSANTALQTVLQAVGQNLFTPTVQPPDPALRETDPIQYFAAKDDFDREVQRINGLKATVEQHMAQMSEQTARQTQETRSEQGRLLKREREDLRTEEGVQLFTARVRAAQNAIGFTQAEVDNYPDRRGLLLLEMAGKYLESVGAIERESPQTKVVEKAKKTLRPGATRQARTAQQKQRRADRDRAKKTGDYRDVAKLLIQ